jgi:hypothetical protein
MDVITHRSLLLTALVAAMATCALASEPVDCFYAERAAKKDSQGGITRHPRCATVQRDGGIRILPGHLRALDFGSDGLATLTIENGRWFYVKRSGRALEVLPFDNGADDFAAGLVRGRRNGKIAFFDHSFRMVLPPKYDFAWPFENGLAAVCSGCTKEAAGSEHRAMTGGLWGYIDRHGKEVIEVQYTRDEAARRKEQRPHR